ncbi:MAG: 23S rRNA (uracil(1939)-C(5))-methyltransferase RlmD [Geosporobacter ferrireducens]|nr:23S rRNA (uracil(1939)-C(5))-methyltransferase RlmD [Geosporobacter ferrireducens]MTI55577.1 23S rRNA (uracil(1939)-C(5))-methyltransferase RlmD [Geosporobacter ferrireducens]
MMNEILKKNEKHLITIEDIGHNGEGIGRIAGMTVFVAGGVPGDLLKIKIEEVKKNYAAGRIIKIVNPSENRVQPICPIAEVCGGCQIQQIDYAAQLQLKTNRVRANIERIGKLENVIIHNTLGMKSPARYRNKAQFPVGRSGAQAIIGFYKKGSHEIVDTESCHIQHEINDQLISIIKTYIVEHQVSTYDEKTGHGLLRHVLTKVGFSTGEIMVILVTNGRELPGKEALIKDLTAKIPGLKSVAQNINTKKGNTILGRECITLYGSDQIVDTLGGLRFNISPLSFFQVNPMQTEVLYGKALEYAGLTGKETVFDVYCGIGTISLFLAKKAKHVYGIEVVEAAIEDAKENARINDIENVTFYAGEAEEVVPKLYREGIQADVVVVDPPRKGCDEKVLDTIVKMNPQRVVYVSCNPATLARDLRYLEDRGYHTVEVQPVDMFPHTSHVECVIMMTYCGSKGK